MTALPGIGLRLLIVLASIAGRSPLHSAVLRATQDTVQKPKWCVGQPRPQYASLERVRVRSSWFEVYRVDPGVYAIYEPHQWEEVISYLIVGRERALLFDTGMGMDNIRAITDQLTQLPVEVLNSHTHSDHIGDNWRYDRILALDDPYTRRNAGGYSHAAVAHEVGPEQFCGPPPPGFDSASYHIRPFRVTETVGDGSIITLGGRQLEVLRIPGHAPDAIALFDAEHKELFTGDTFYEGPIYVLSEGANFAAFTRSAERLATFVPRLHKLFTAHNVAVSDSAKLLRLRDATRAISSGTVAGVTDNSITTYDFGGFSIMVRTGS